MAAWLGSEAAWFLVLNAVVAAIAVLSSLSRARPSASPRSGGGATRRASSVLLQRLRSFTIFSYPSACFDTPTTSPQPAAQATVEPAVTQTQPRMAMAMPSPRALVLTPQPAPAAEEEEEEEEDGDPNAMSMEDAYALVLASRRPPEPEARQSDDVYANDKESLRQQRLNSIFNYTQMLKQRALGARRDQL